MSYVDRCCLALLLLVYCNASIVYDRVSRTTNNNQCLNTCANGKCYVDHHLNERACTADALAGAPTYKTALKKGSYTLCLSNCGKFGGYDYNWCYTTENYNWDYCNPVVSSTTGGWGSRWGHTIYGEPCIDSCLRSEYTSFWCHKKDQSYVNCANPAEVPVQSCQNIFKRGNRFRRSPVEPLLSDALCSMVCRARVRDGYDGETMQRMANTLTQRHTFPIETIRNFPADSPYTFVATRNETNSLGVQVYLPLIVQATLRHLPSARRTSGDVPPSALRNTANMFDGDSRGRDAGHVIGFINGGTRDLFNYVSQTIKTNRSPYKVIEGLITDWLRSESGYVEMTVVVDYLGTTPHEFAVKVKFFYNDGSLYSDCLDIIVSNT